MEYGQSHFDTARVAPGSTGSAYSSTGFGAAPSYQVAPNTTMQSGIADDPWARPPAPSGSSSYELHPKGPNIYPTGPYNSPTYNDPSGMGAIGLPPRYPKPGDYEGNVAPFMDTPGAGMGGAASPFQGNVGSDLSGGAGVGNMPTVPGMPDGGRMGGQGYAFGQQTGWTPGQGSPFTQLGLTPGGQGNPSGRTAIAPGVGRAQNMPTRQWPQPVGQRPMQGQRTMGTRQPPAPWPPQPPSGTPPQMPPQMNAQVPGSIQAQWPAWLQQRLQGRAGFR